MAKGFGKKQQASGNTKGQKAYRDFLDEILWATAESVQDPEFMFWFIRNNQNKLNDGFVQFLRHWVKPYLAKEALTKAELMAMTIRVFSTHLFEYSFGDMEINIEVSIAGLKVADAVFTRELFPKEWGLNQKGLASLYRRRIRGDRSENLEKAMTACQEALQVFSRDKFPQEWAITQNTFGLVYSDRIEGDIAENQEKAIACYKGALEVFTREVDATEWGRLHHNLGLAYRRRIKGDLRENQETAIAYYQAALEVRTREEFPKKWAQTQGDLGIVYSGRLLGDPRENIEKAIAYYQAALEIYSPTVFPADFDFFQRHLLAANKFIDYLDLSGKEIAFILQIFQAIDNCIQLPEPCQKLDRAFHTIWEFFYGEREDIDEGFIKSLDINLEMGNVVAEKEFYTFLSANLEKLDDNFIQLFRNWATVKISTVDRDEAEMIAMHISLFSCLIQKFTQGNIAINLEIAITGYEIVSSFLSDEQTMIKKLLWSENLGNLSVAYRERIRGNKADNLEKAISLCQTALKIVTRDNHPQLWANLQNNLGGAYGYRIKGEKAENMELAIKYIEASLEVYAKEKYPKEWANSQNTLGIVYSERVKGDRQENLETAIECCEAALQVLARNEFPELYGASKMNLANAYRDRLKGNPVQNLEMAIVTYHDALKVLTKEAFPEKWARTQNNLGMAYSRIKLGNFAGNQELARTAYEAALQVFTEETFPQEWAMAQHNLGMIYAEENLDKAMTAHQAAARVLTRDAFPKNWAANQQNMAAVYIQLGNIEKAIACYQSALELFTPTTFPMECLTTARQLGEISFGAQRWAEAIEGYGIAIETVETTRTWTPSESRRQEIMKDAIDVYFKMVQACINAGNLEKALEYAERSKSKPLVDLVDRYQTDDIPPETEKEYFEYFKNFLDRMLLITVMGNGDPKATHPVLQTYLEQDPDFIQKFGSWIMENRTEVIPKEAIRHAGVLTILGNGIYEFPLGSPADNVETAIALFKVALSVAEQNESADLITLKPTTLSFLAAAYRNRIRGDRAENLEFAICKSEEALQLITRETEPELWGQIHNSLGLTYRDRIWGDKTDNLELAIAYYQNALQVRTRDEYPKEWAQTQMNLAVAYRHRIKGDKAENLELAITANQAALQVYTPQKFAIDWGGVNLNLGNVYLERIIGGKSENLNLAIASYKNALQVITKNKFPHGWAGAKMNLGNAYKDSQINEALACYREAFEIFTPTNFPENCFLNGKNMGYTAFFAELWPEAIEGFAAAVEAIETTRTWTPSESRRQEIMKDAIDVYFNMVQACINAGNLEKAVEYAERSKSKLLLDIMASNDRYQTDDIPPEVEELLQQYNDLQAQIDRERHQQTADSNPGARETRTSDRASFHAYNQTIAGLESQKQNIWEQLRRLDPVLAGEIQVSAPDIAAMQRLIDKPTAAILSFYHTSSDTHIFILRQDSISLHTCPQQGIEELQRYLGENWLSPYLQQSEWFHRLDSILDELGDRLQLNDLIAQHLHGIEELIIVPHLLLHLIPFEAIAVSDSPPRYLGDKFLIRYAPSCQILEFCHQRGEVDVETFQYGIVEDAQDNLPCAAWEGDRLAELLGIPATNRLRGRSQATCHNYRQLAEKVQVLHSCHHAESRLDRPLESVLKLGDGDITLGQLMSPGWRLPHLSDIFLSCCETGLGMPPLTDDILTLAAGFLCAGARSVVNTLWGVDDLATALVCTFYYRRRQQGESRPQALWGAQMELCNFSNSDFAELSRQVEAKRKEARNLRKQYREASAEYEESDREYKKYLRITNQLSKIPNSSNQPFSHRQYWAAFTCQGLS